MTLRTTSPFLLAALLSACTVSLDDARFETGSSTIIASAGHDALFAVEADAGLVARVTPDGAVTTFEAAGEPTRIARAGDRVFVTLRTERQVTVFRDVDGQLEGLGTIEVGAEPYGVVASEDGSTAWVAASLSDEVVQIDVETLQITARFAVDGEPRWLALTPGARSLFVGTARAGLQRIDLDDGAVLAVSLPTIENQAFETGEVFDATARVTGDPAVSPNGKILAVPVLYVDNTTPVPPPSLDESEDEFFEGGDGYSAGGGGRFNPTVVLIPLRPGGETIDDQGQVIPLSGMDGDFQGIRGYGASVSFSPDGEQLLVPLEGSGAVLAIDATIKPEVQGLRPLGRGMGEDIAVPMFDGGFSGSFTLTTMQSQTTWTVQTAAAPRGVAFLDDGAAWVHAAFDHSVQDLGLIDVSLNVSRGGPFGRRLVEDFEGLSSFAAAPVVIADEVLPAEVAQGRRLFYSATDSHMAAPGAGVSCATCHADGRNDGLTWTFEEGVRQTPSLAGVVSLTEPVTWTGEVPTVQDEVVTTSQGRMGGDGLSAADAAKVAAFVDWTREADIPLPDAAAVERGRLVFERADVGCADCHSGVSYTDNEAYAMYGLDNVTTRSLVGIAASAPYLHDGSAPTLRAVVERSRDGEMGDTSMLSDTEKADLTAYLRSL